MRSISFWMISSSVSPTRFLTTMMVPLGGYAITWCLLHFHPQTALRLSGVTRMACLRHASVVLVQDIATSSSVCQRHTILFTPHEAQRRVGLKKARRQARL